MVINNPAHMNNNIEYDCIKPSNQKKGVARLDRKKNAPTVCCPQETHFGFKDTDRLKVEEQKKICHINSRHKRSRLMKYQINGL